MDRVDFRRNLTRLLIGQNPMWIQLRRATLVDDGTGNTVSGPAEPIAAQRFRVFPLREARELHETGGSRNPQGWGLVAEHDADVMVGDTFDLGSLVYRVATVAPALLDGEVVSWAADLEAM